jgi:diguanylate cyclase (GGDEF)-like protein
MIWAERVRELVSMEPVLVHQHTITITLSIGLVDLSAEKHVSLDDAIREADIALYQAKETGRNRVCYFNRVTSILAV